MSKKPSISFLFSTYNAEAWLEKVLYGFMGIDHIEKKQGTFKVRLKDGYKASELSAYLITNGIDITHFSHQKGSLEQEFLHLLSENRA